MKKFANPIDFLDGLAVDLDGGERSKFGLSHGMSPMRGNLVLAEATARELGRLTLDEALSLLLLYAARA